ncbi:hypothetical protein MesoLjLa_21620 [Mesorhizobium sp. L-2-11]|nr:hypothetical protein MesoLjLa_21620 [Mesorhizobium sp. L-2-11]
MQLGEALELTFQRAIRSRCSFRSARGTICRKLARSGTMLTLDDNAVIITGESSGIGRAAVPGVISQVNAVDGGLGLT